MYGAVAFGGLVAFVVGIVALHEWVSNWLHQRRRARAPVVNDVCPLCGYKGFNSYGLRICPQCKAEVTVQSFVPRCVFCGHGPVSYGPSLCDGCGKGLWCGTTVTSCPGAEHTWEYQALHSEEFAADLRELYAEAQAVSANGKA